jgi:RNA polymerase sigma factor (sigma-70 family)
VDTADWPADFEGHGFEEHRAHLRSVAYRMLGSLNEADDAVQEAWLRLSRADAGGVRDLRAWLTTVVSRVCLDILRSRASRREDPLDVHMPDPIVTRVDDDPAEHAILADSVGIALLVVLDTLPPAERLAFVLHDVFAVPFDEIGPILDRSPAAAKQLASRARQRLRNAPAHPAAARGSASAPVRGSTASGGTVPGSTVPGGKAPGSKAPGSTAPGSTAPGSTVPVGAAPDGAVPGGDASAGPGDLARQWTVVDAFLAASREGDFEGLLAILDPDVVLRADAGAGPFGPSVVVRGAREVIAQAQRFAPLNRFARQVLVNGAPGFLVVRDGEPLALMAVTVQDGKVTEMDVLADPARLARLDLAELIEG